MVPSLRKYGAGPSTCVIWSAGRQEIHPGKKQKFLTVVCNLETGEPLWAEPTGRRNHWDTFFREEVSERQRRRIEAACVDIWEPFRLSIEHRAPQCRIIYDKFHISTPTMLSMRYDGRSFSGKAARMRDLVKGKRWLLLTYHYEGAMLNYLQQWIDQLRWQRLKPFEKLDSMLLKHLEAILNYCRTKVPLGVVETVNGNIKTLLRRGRGYKNLCYLLLKPQRMAATRTEFVVFRKAA